MKLFDNFEDFNNYVGLTQPFDLNIDVGEYPASTLLKSEGIGFDFYRISFKTNYYNPEINTSNTPITAIFFNSPGNFYEWDLAESFEGFYLHISKEIINKHRYLFQNYLEYGEHEALYLKESEEKELINIFKLIISHYNHKLEDYDVLISYVNLLLNLVESFYKRQFKTETKKYNLIVSEFQQLLMEYYNQPFEGVPTVNYFAQKLKLSANYLGDIIKSYTNKSAIETIHEFVIDKAKEKLMQTNSTSADVAYELGFDYPNYFSKLFKKQTNVTPKQFKTQQISTEKRNP